MLIIGRAIAGVGGSGLLNGSYTIIASIVPTAKQPCMRSYSPSIKGRAAANLLDSIPWSPDGSFVLWFISRPVDWRCFDRVRELEMVYFFPSADDRLIHNSNS
jgi:MFS family permease